MVNKLLIIINKVLEKIIMNFRNKNIDAIRGFAIILVVFGHSMAHPPIYQPVWLKGIFSFHMPLMMMISGYLSYKSDRINDFIWLKKRLKMLLIPFFTWVLITAYNRYHFNEVETYDYIKNVFISPDSAYWFLFTLSEFCIILFLCNKFIIYTNSEKFGFIVYMSVIIILNYLFWKRHIQILGMYLMAWHSVFFFSGYIINEYNIIVKFKKIINNVFFKTIGVFLFLVLFPFWDLEPNIPLYLQYFNSLIDNHHIQKLFWFFMRYFVPFTGIFFSYSLIQILPRHIKNLFSYVGKYTLEIYILSNYLFFTVSNNVFIDIPIKTAISISLSILISNIIKNGYISTLLLGKKSTLK